MKKNLLRLCLGLFLVFSCLVGASFRTQASKGTENNSAELSDLTQRVAALSGLLQNKNNFARVEFERLAAERFAKLNELAEKNPSEVLSAALPPDVLAKIPAELQMYFEKNIDTEGELEVIYECDDRSETLKYFLKTEKQRLPIYFAKEPERDLQSGSRVRLKAVRLGDALILSSDVESSDFQLVNSITANTFGEQKVLVLLVNFQDNQTQPYTVDEANNLIFNSANNSSVTNYYREASYQQTWLTGNSYGWFTLPINSGDCSGTSIASAAKQSATNAGINLSLYNKFIYVFPQMTSCSYTGIAGVGGNEVWVNGSMILRTVAHELGHNFGLYHSRALDCDGTVTGGTCTTIEYGNMGDMMGASKGHFQSFQKERLGWLNYGSSPPITTVQSSGNYFIAPYSVMGASPKALKIQIASGVWYYIEYRQPVGFDSTLAAYYGGNLTSGVLISKDTPATPKENYQLDMVPGTQTWIDSALTVNQSYTDSTAGITIKTVSADSSGATVSVTFGNNPTPTPTPSPCVLANPTISVSPSTTQMTGAGSPVNYTFTVTNNNDSNCTNNNFNLQANLPSGWAGALSTTNLTISPGQSATGTLQVTSPAATADGYYSVELNAVNSSNSSYSASQTLTVGVLSALGMNVTTSQTTYTLTQTASITAQVMANGSPVAGANVNFTVIRPNGTSSVGSAVTASDGRAVFVYKFNRKKDTAGTFTVNSVASFNGANGSGSAQFTVR
jgi:hypothetical protein